MTSTAWVVLSCVIYGGVMIGIGGAFFKKSSTVDDYFLGGRNLNPWVAAMSAQASDMSGWLLMGLPGAVYAFGTGQIWIAVGLAAGTCLNWIFVAKRLRRYTIKAGNAITIPQYFENRFHDNSHILRIASAIFIAVFFAVYTASAFVAGGTLFSQVLGMRYEIALLISVLLILTYTFLGGFLAVCWTDLIQGLLMLVAILAVPILAVIACGGIGQVTAGLPSDFLNIMMDKGQPITGTSIISQLAWGLGYFGMPHILVRFMAIESERSVKKSSVIALVWVFLSLSFAVAVGVVGVAFVPGLGKLNESVFIQMIQKLFLEPGSFVPVPLLGGFFLCGILAAIMSTADSQLLVTASAVSGDLYKGAVNPKVTDKRLMQISRGSVVAVAAAAYLIALDPESSIMGLVSNAWSGFGSAFGALVVLSLYWKRVNRAGAAAGIISGGLTVIIWDYLPVGGATLGASTNLYSLVPGFAISFLSIVVISLLTKAPSKEMLEEYQAVSGNTESF